MPDVTESPANLLKGKTAGVPNSVWAVVIAAGLGYAWYKKRKNANTPAQDQTASDNSSTTSGAAPAQFLPINPPTNNPSSSANTAFTSNADWLAAALRWSLANGNTVNPPMDAVTTGTALGTYLAGGALTVREQAIVNAILGGVGPPPFPPEGNVILTPPPSPVAPPPVSIPPIVDPPVRPPIVPPTQRTYTVKSGDNLTKIGRMFGVSWQAIYNANRNKIRNPNLIYPNQVLIIP